MEYKTIDGSYKGKSSGLGRQDIYQTQPSGRLGALYLRYCNHIMVNKSISYKLLLFSLLICVFESCTNAIIPHYIRKKFHNHTASNYNLNDNLININNGYYQYTIEIYRPKRIDTVLSYSNDGKIEKKQ
jgi:hypothetical protein